MSHQTVRLAECASEIRESCDRFLTISPVASASDVQDDSTSFYRHAGI